ncbi:MAG: hypothetical protein M1828_003025 [Chrysothrix sp. TS-e1954]|nr:MAG: hypothetical protein M1828_003025 [Chrysothrix sp. TS-e1954]
MVMQRSKLREVNRMQHSFNRFSYFHFLTPSISHSTRLYPRLSSLVMAATKITQAQAFSRLELTATTDLPTIRSAYRILVLKHHPDKSGTIGSTSRFQEIQEAYEYLCEHPIVLPIDTHANLTPLQPLRSSHLSARQSAWQRHAQQSSRGKQKNAKQQSTRPQHKQNAQNIPRHHAKSQAEGQRTGRSPAPSPPPRPRATSPWRDPSYARPQARSFQQRQEDREGGEQQQQQQQQEQQEQVHEQQQEQQQEQQPPVPLHRCCDPDYTSWASPLNTAYRTWASNQVRRHRAALLSILHPSTTPAFSGPTDAFAEFTCTCVAPLSYPPCEALAHFSGVWNAEVAPGIADERERMINEAFEEVLRCLWYCEDVVKEARAISEALDGVLPVRGQQAKYRADVNLVGVMVDLVGEALKEARLGEVIEGVIKAMREFKGRWGVAVGEYVWGGLEEYVEGLRRRVSKVRKKLRELRY